jgi:hypothetical protein
MMKNVLQSGRVLLQVACMGGALQHLQCEMLHDTCFAALVLAGWWLMVVTDVAGPRGCRKPSLNPLRSEGGSANSMVKRPSVKQCACVHAQVVLSPEELQGVQRCCAWDAQMK